MFNKKGVDAVVATVLIIMITVAAVAIIWAVVIPMIKDTATSATAEKVSLSIETSGGYTTWDASSEIATVQVKRGVDTVNLSAIKLTFFNGKETYSIQTTAPSANVQTTYQIPLIGFGKPLKVSISPIFNNGKDGEILQEVSNLRDNAADLEWPAGEVAFNFTSGENITIPIAYNNHNCNSSYYDCSWNYHSDALVSCPSPSFCTVNDGPSRGWQCYDDPASLSSGRCTFGNLGTSCTDDHDCLSSRCAIDECTFDCQGTTLCVAGNIGDYCDSNSDCDSGICGGSFTCSSGEVASYCWDVSQCNEGLFCDTSSSGTCTTGVSGLASCGTGSSCASGFCDTYYSVCSNGAVDDNCGSDSDCSSNSCESYHYQCKANKSVRTFCGYYGECDSQYCNSVTHLCEIPTLTSALYLYFPFNETSGTTVYDYSGNSRTGTFAVTSTNPAINQTGKVGKAYKFDGINDYIDLTGKISWGWTSPYTVSFWVNGSSPMNYSDFLLGGASNDYNFNGGKLTVYSGSTAKVSSVSAAATNTWQHWVITREYPYTIKIYLNGALSASITTYYDYNTYAPKYLGRSTSSGYFGGMIDEVAVWSRTLNSTEISELYARTTQLK
jgi:hypothetical protein